MGDAGVTWFSNVNTLQPPGKGGPEALRESLRLFEDDGVRFERSNVRYNDLTNRVISELEHIPVGRVAMEVPVLEGMTTKERHEWVARPENTKGIRCTAAQFDYRVKLLQGVLEGFQRLENRLDAIEEAISLLPPTRGGYRFRKKDLKFSSQRGYDSD